MDRHTKSRSKSRPATRRNRTSSSQRLARSKEKTTKSQSKAQRKRKESKQDDSDSESQTESQSETHSRTKSKHENDSQLRRTNRWNSLSNRDKQEDIEMVSTSINTVCCFIVWISISVQMEIQIVCHSYRLLLWIINVQIFTRTALSIKIDLLSLNFLIYMRFKFINIVCTFVIRNSCSKEGSVNPNLSD